MGDLYCALCMLTRNGIADPACTTINGTAACYDHAKVMTSGDFETALAYLRHIQERTDES